LLIVDRVCAREEQLLVEGPRYVAHTYEGLSLLSPGVSISWQGGARTGEVIGLGSRGQLRVRSDGREEELFAEDVQQVRKLGSDN
jgi:hypothetical protein